MSMVGGKWMSLYSGWVRLNISVTCRVRAA